MLLSKVYVVEDYFSVSGFSVSLSLSLSFLPVSYHCLPSCLQIPPCRSSVSGQSAIKRETVRIIFALSILAFYISAVSPGHTPIPKAHFLQAQAHPLPGALPSAGTTNTWERLTRLTTHQLCFCVSSQIPPLNFHVFPWISRMLLWFCPFQHFVLL